MIFVYILSDMPLYVYIYIYIYIYYMYRCVKTTFNDYVRTIHSKKHAYRVPSTHNYLKQYYIGIKLRDLHVLTSCVPGIECC